MKKNQTFIRRKYIQQNSEGKRLCQIYRVEFIQGKDWQPTQIQKVQTPNQTVRINKNYQNNQVPVWAQINQRQNFGYQTPPQSPISYFNDQQETQVDYFGNNNKMSFYSWDNAQATQNWY